MSKRTTKKSLGLTPTKKKTKESVIERSMRLKAIEMAKPVDKGMELLWEAYNSHKIQMEMIKEQILEKAPISRKKGFRFESFIYVKESDIPDRVKMEDKWHEIKGFGMPNKLVTDWNKVKKVLGKDCPMKKRKAYLKEVKK